MGISEKLKKGSMGEAIITNNFPRLITDTISQF
jgi:hypothetical protein